MIECVGALGEELGPGRVDLLTVFVSPHFAGSYMKLPAMLEGSLDFGTLIGCSAGGVIGGGVEVEQRPAVTLIGARLPGVEITPFHVDLSDLPDLDGPPQEWEELIGVAATEEPQFILLADPFTSHPDLLLAGLDYAFPGSAKVGGMASGGSARGQNALFLNDLVLTDGVAGVALAGDIVIETVVAQGCRPIGELLQITRAHRNIVYELDGRTAMEALQDTFVSLSGQDKQLARTSLFLGVLMDEFRQKPRQGDFLIRNIIGLDPESGAIAVGERVQEGMQVQFHLRDADTSAQDLHAMLSGFRRSSAADISGALLFSCLGRGEYLYGRPNFDTSVFRQHMGEVPVGGFFCNGEIGPVGGTTFLHGYTSSFGMFRPKR